MIEPNQIIVWELLRLNCCYFFWIRMEIISKRIFPAGLAAAAAGLFGAGLMLSCFNNSRYGTLGKGKLRSKHIECRNQRTGGPSFRAS